MDFSRILTDPYIMFLSILAILSLVVLCIYYGLFYMRVGLYHRNESKSSDSGTGNTTFPPVSIVLTAHNEADWLRQNLVYLLEQDYPDFEVVVVDYQSTDDTMYVLQLLAENYKNLKIVPIKENANGYNGKKYPFAIGIKSAKNDILLLADPECVPSDQQGFGWIKSMVQGYTNSKVEIVLGYCGIEHRGSLLGWLEQYDNLDYSTEYLGAALLHHPFTGNGRNLSYRRSLFMRNDGFIYHYYIPDGADDMFVRQNSNRNNTTVSLRREAFTQVAPRQSLRQWIEYRHHRTATHRYYSLGLKLMRLLRPLSVLLFYLSTILLLVNGGAPWQIVASLMVLKIAWQIVCTSQATARLNIKPIIFWVSPLMEIYFLFANTILAISPLPKKI